MCSTTLLAKSVPELYVINDIFAKYHKKKKIHLLSNRGYFMLCKDELYINKILIKKRTVRSFSKRDIVLPGYLLRILAPFISGPSKN